MKDDSVKVELVYITSDKGILGCTVILRGERYSVTVLGKHTTARFVEIGVRSWLDNPDL